MSKILNLGIDISMRKAVCCFLDQEGKYLGKVSEVENNPSGFEKLEKSISHALSTGSYNLIRIGLEASSLYGFHLIDYFKTRSLPVAIKVYQINAKYINRFKRAFSEKEKTDLVDAEFIAEYLRFGKLPVEYEPDKLHLPLRRLVRYRYHLVKTIERETKLYLANLFLKFPGWVQTRPIKTLSKTSLEILGEFSPDELTQMPLKELALFVARAGKNRSPDPEAIASELQKVARES